MNKLLVIGTVAFDEIETPFGQTNKILGGAGSYIALSASFFDVNVGLVSVVGEDFPKGYFELLRQRGINTEGVEIVSGGKTFFWKGKYQHDLNHRDTLQTELNVLADFHPKVPPQYRDAEVMMLGNLQPSVQEEALSQMNKPPKFVILDTMNYWMDNCLDDLKRVIPKVHLISINDQEARQLSGEYSLLKAARAIQKMGSKYVVIKKGEHGALLFLSQDIFFAPALPLEEVFDPTGAGDSFAGGMAGYLTHQSYINESQLKNAVIQGCNTASFCVEKFGTERLIMADKHQVKNRLKKFLELTKFDL